MSTQTKGLQIHTQISLTRGDQVNNPLKIRGRARYKRLMWQLILVSWVIFNCPTYISSSLIVPLTSPHPAPAERQNTFPLSLTLPCRRREHKAVTTHSSSSSAGSFSSMTRGYTARPMVRCQRRFSHACASAGIEKCWFRTWSVENCPVFANLFEKVPAQRGKKGKIAS